MSDLCPSGHLDDPSVRSRDHRLGAGPEQVVDLDTDREQDLLDTDREQVLLGGIETLLDLRAGELATWETRATTAERRAMNLERAMASRAEIEQAKGILMQRHSIDADAAFAKLRQTSMTTNIKLYEIAVALVEEAIRSADERPPSPAP